MENNEERMHGESVNIDNSEQAEIEKIEKDLLKNKIEEVKLLLELSELTKNKEMADKAFTIITDEIDGKIDEYELTKLTKKHNEVVNVILGNKISSKSLDKIDSIYKEIIETKDSSKLIQISNIIENMPDNKEKQVHKEKYENLRKDLVEYSRAKALMDRSFIEKEPRMLHIGLNIAGGIKVYNFKEELLEYGNELRMRFDDFFKKIDEIDILISKATYSKAKDDIKKAQEKLNEIDDCRKKEELQKRLDKVDAIQNEIDDKTNDHDIDDNNHEKEIDNTNQNEEILNPNIKGNKPKLTWKTIASVAMGLGVGVGATALFGAGSIIIVPAAGLIAKKLINKKKEKIMLEQRKIAEAGEVTEVQEPTGKIKKTMYKFKKYLNSEEGLRDLEFFVNAVTISGTATSIGGNAFRLLYATGDTILTAGAIGAATAVGSGYAINSISKDQTHNESLNEDPETEIEETDTVEQDVENEDEQIPVDQIEDLEPERQINNSNQDNIVIDNQTETVPDELVTVEEPPRRRIR